ncbi:PREDICTED: cytochrome P450 2G1-like [Gekko japonicus]|uniref:Cytochrome P450 2G1-like n=1 Tax=Gekko japonicus TaxID=146911 RepID=A0ABM1JM17_GEKJA|nr:PREDICTED: cytochrome P450 2G1-like [Gekko japonicus]
MELASALTVLLAICLVVITAKRKMSSHGRLPPGPTPLPVIGNFLQIKAAETCKSLIKVRKVYRPLFRPLRQPLCTFLLVSLQPEKGRDVIWVPFSLGVVFANGERWKQLRRFSLKILRDFGMGKKTIEQRIQEEAQFLLEEFRKTNGESAESHAPWVYDIYANILKFFPGPHTKIYDMLGNLRHFIAKRAEKNRETLDLNSPRDFIDCKSLLQTRCDQESKHFKWEKNNPASEFNVENMELTTLTLFFGGTETVSSTLRNGFLLLMKYPQIQAKMHEEIDRVIGQNRAPNIEDRNQMPYTDAVIHEVQRVSDLLPMDVPHMVTRDTEFRGYLIPKGTEVYPLLTTVLNDPTKFGNPRQFNPEHFLDADGSFKKNDAFVPFSSGKRICLGEALARMELFLFFTTVLQSFRLKPLVPPEDIDTTPLESGFANIVPTYQMCMVPR